jgi:2-amino-4-hydroxy-6-hydroxymethyldihydropteridine diphosphokinase
LSGPKPAESRAWLGLGGNIGDPRSAMAAALRSLQAHEAVRVSAVSSLYRTPPWGKTDQPDFLNAVAALDTRLSPRGLLQLCLSMERDLKRVRAERWGPRLIDMDILAFGDLAISEEGLTVPHPRMAGRAFVMVPLAELAPSFAVDGRDAAQIAAALDTGGIERVAGPDWWR